MEACVVAFCTGLPDNTFNNRYGEHLSQQGAVGPTAWVTKLSEGGDNTTPEQHSKTLLDWLMSRWPNCTILLAVEQILWLTSDSKHIALPKTFALSSSHLLIVVQFDIL